MSNQKHCYEMKRKKRRKIQGLDEKECYKSPTNCLKDYT
jgi:hypothetical protein